MAGADAITVPLCAGMVLIVEDDEDIRETLATSSKIMDFAWSPPQTGRRHSRS